ncbi:MAG: hypothetical protein IJ587_05035 [Synergistaceae bacterium]|nr:hypothetical protein [Synergistaceae bacterium]
MKWRFSLFLTLTVLLVCVNISRGRYSPTDVSGSKFVYIGIDSYLGAWYLNTSSYYHDKDEFIEFEIMTENLFPYRKDILKALVRRFRRRALELPSKIHRMSHYYVYNVKSHVGCISRMLFYDNKGELICHVSFGISSNKSYFIDKNTLAGRAADWIVRDLK